MEVWKTVVVDGVTYDGYEVSNYGKVRSLNYNGTKGKVQELKLTKDKDGYLQVHLWKNGKTRVAKVHRLVAFIWIPNDDTEHKTQVNHIDEDKTNNHYTNLEWTTPKQNTGHGTGIERRAKTQSKRVLCVETGIIYESTVDASKQTGLSQGNIVNVCNGKQKTTGGYHWEYVE